MNPEPALRTRPARSEDEPFVCGLAGRFAESRPAWRTFREVAEGTSAQLHAAFVRGSDDEALFIAEADGVRLGFVYVVTHEDFFTSELHGHVSEIAVAREGAGVGRALMATAEAWCRARRVRFLTLNVNEDNRRAQEFYRRLGFEPQVRQFVKVFE